MQEGQNIPRNCVAPDSIILLHVLRAVNYDLKTFFDGASRGGLYEFVFEDGKQQGSPILSITGPGNIRCFVNCFTWNNKIIQDIQTGSHAAFMPL
jgi:hypothetical protein